MKATKGSRILSNPYSVLGLPCNASKLDIIKAQEKINKLAKIGAEKSYKTDFFNEVLPEINRSPGTIQTSIANLDELSNKLFWFVDPYNLKNFDSEEIRNEFENECNFENIKYDCFLANYLYLLVEDSELIQIKHWEKLFCYIEFLFSCNLSYIKDLLNSRYQDVNDNAWASINSTLKTNILSPIEELVDDSEPKYIIKLLNILSGNHTVEFDTLNNNLLEKLVLEIEKKCSYISDFINSIEDIKSVSKVQVLEAEEFANNLSDISLSIIEPLTELNSNEVTIERIKDFLYNEMISLANILAFGKNFKDAYACATQANKYAPSYKKSEIKDTLKTFKILNDSLEVIDRAGGIENLNYMDINLIKSSEIRISILAYRALGGEPESQYILGNIYKTPKSDRNEPIDIPYDVAEGIKWIKKSANQGYAAAELALGMCYISGEGVAKNFRIADSWIQKSASQGNEEAKAIISDYRYATLKMQLDRDSSYSGNTDSQPEGNSWVGWFVTIIIIVFILLIASNNS